jgi:23S rRNA pseudouridine1911/1915/1917 synthase
VIERYDSKEYGQYTLVEVILHTGRTHQIRVHLSHIGHIITGDVLYGGGTQLMQRQALHAYYIEFDHPITRERVSFRTGLPDDISKAIYKLKNSAD